MKAYALEVIDGPFRKITIPTPSPAPGEVLVKIYASGLNPLDTKIRAGKAEHACQPPPAVLCMDMAGIVERVGPGVTAFRAGDEVFGMVGGVGGLQGTLAEYVAADAALLGLKPKALSMRQAAELSDRGALKPLLAKQQFTADERAAAFDLVSAGVTGKVVIEF